MFENPTYGSKAPENETSGTHKGENIFCPVNAYGACPYCDQCDICHVADPMEDCDDFGAFFDSWEDWEDCGDSPSWEELKTGFNEFAANP